MNNKELTEIAKMVGSWYGYDDVEAEFSNLAEFKVKWGRSYKWAQLTVTDYIKDAPDGVIEALLTMIFERFKGNYGPYPEALLDYITSEKFIEKNIYTYIKRHRGTRPETIAERDGITTILTKGTPNYSVIMKLAIINEEDDFDKAFAEMKEKIEEGRNQLMGVSD